MPRKASTIGGTDWEVVLVNRLTRYFVLDDQDRPLRCEDAERWVKWMAISGPQRCLHRHFVGPFLVTTAFVGWDKTSPERDQDPGLLIQSSVVAMDGRESPFAERTWDWLEKRDGTMGHQLVLRTVMKYLEQIGEPVDQVVDALVLAREETGMN